MQVNLESRVPDEPYGKPGTDDTIALVGHRHLMLVESHVVRCVGARHLEELGEWYAHFLGHRMKGIVDEPAFKPLGHEPGNSGVAAAALP
jgi:hypothetical protein